MIIKQILNNNVVISENDKNEEIVVMGRGLAFGAKKGQVIPEDRIQKVFTDEKNCDFSHFTKLLSEIDLVNFEFIENLINYVKSTLGKKLNNSIYITLTDHINTLLERAATNAYVKNTMLWDIKRIYRDEFKIARDVVCRINERLGSNFDDNEAASITMHIVNAELETNMKTAVDITKTMTDILNIVKYHFKIIYDEECLYLTIHIAKVVRESKSL